MIKLGDQEVSERLQSLEGWTLDHGKLFREFEFDSFPRAFGFMTAVAVTCESMNHHPEWTNVYSTVKVWLVTHDAEGISERDFELAAKMNSLHKPA